MYTWSKSIDDDASVGGQGPVGSQSAAPSGEFSSAASSSAAVSPAQNWLNLLGERGLSTFDQRNLLTVQAQYTSGMGLRGGTLVGGWRGKLIKEWTLLTQITAGSGLPETPVYLELFRGRARRGRFVPIGQARRCTRVPRGYFLNPAAFTAPGRGNGAVRDATRSSGRISSVLTRRWRAHFA